MNTATTRHSHSLLEDVKREGALVVTTAKQYSADNCTSLAAGIAFYSAFSLAPTLVMVLTVVGWVFGAEAARGQIFARIHDFLGNEAATAIQAIVENAHRGEGGGIAAVLSVVLLIVGASATFSSLNTALDIVLPASKEEQKSSLTLMIKVRLVSFGLVMGIAFLLVISLVLDTAVSYVGEVLWSNSLLAIVGDIVQFVLSLAVLACAFTALLKWLPDSRVQWRHALVGGAVSAVLFSFGKKLFALYLAHIGTANAFGAAGSLAVLLMWLYFSAAVLLLGAEFVATLGGFDARKGAEHSTSQPPGQLARDATGAQQPGWLAVARLPLDRKARGRRDGGAGAALAALRDIPASYAARLRLMLPLAGLAVRLVETRSVKRYEKRTEKRLSQARAAEQRAAKLARLAKRYMARHDAVEQAARTVPAVGAASAAQRTARGIRRARGWQAAGEPGAAREALATRRARAEHRHLLRGVLIASGIGVALASLAAAVRTRKPF